MISTKY